VTSAVTKPTAAPQNEIGYAQAPNYNWWQYQDETTPELQWPQSIAVYDAMRRTDAQVTSVLRAMTLPVRSTPWRIDPNGASDEVTEFVADNLGLPVVGTEPKAPLRQQDRFSWDEHLRQALLMLPFGHMYFEQTYRIDEDGKRARLRKLGPRMPKTIEFINVAEDGGLVSITQYWTRTDRRPQPIPVNRLVAYIHEREGGNWLGSSILRPGYKNWLLKDRLLRVWAQTIERNGMGVPRYTGAENEQSLTAGLAMARAWRSGESAGTAIPFGSQLDLVGVNGTLPDAEPAVRYHDEQLGRAVLAHFLNLGTQTGSWALGTTFADFFTLSLQSLAQQVQQTGSLYIIEDLVDINFGPDEPAPKLVCDEIGSRQPATAQSLVALFGAGALTPDDRLEESLRQQYGLPPKQPQFLVDQPGDGPAPPPDVEAIEVQARASYPGQKWRHGWIPFGDKGTKAPDAPSKPASMSDLAIELAGLEPSRQRTHMADLGYTLSEIDEVLGPDRPASMSDLAAELEDLSPAKRRRLLKAMGFSAAEIAELLGAPVQASAHIDVDDDAEPGQFDEATAALIAALADFTGEIWAADFDESKHLRGPGGKFRNMFGRIQRALADWSNGDGAHDPLAEFKDRAPLMDAAKKRGVPLKRGASRDEIVRALLDDIRDKRAAARGEEAPPKPSHRLTLSSPRYRDQDVGVYAEKDGKVSLYREASPFHRGSKVVTVDSLADLEQWGRDNDEPQVAKWAASERGGKAPDVKKAAPKKAPAKKAAPVERAPAAKKIPSGPVTDLDREDQARVRRLIRRDPQIFATVQDRFGRVSTSGNLSNEDADWLQGIYERDRAFVEYEAQGAELDRRIKDAAKAAGQTPAEYKAAASARLKEVLADKPIVVRVRDEGALRDILSGGRFKTQLEGARRAPGLTGDPDRRRLGESVMGVPADAPAGDRPVYGYVAVAGIEPALSEGRKLPGIREREGQEDVLSSYGKVQVVLRPEVRERTTATVGDSLDEIGFLRPSPVNDPSIDSLGFRKLDRVTEPGFTRSGYVEAQIHGGIRTEDIAEVVFPDDPDRATVAALERQGVSWRILRPGDASAPPAKAAPAKKAPLSAVDSDGKAIPVPSKEDRDRALLGDAEYERRKAAKKAPAKKAAAPRKAPAKRVPATPAPAKAVPASASPPPVKGRDLRGELDFKALVDSPEDDPNQDGMLAQIWAQQGFDGPPQIVTDEEWDRLRGDGGVVLYRGVQGWREGTSAEEIADSYRTGEHYAGLGSFGNGSYFGDQRNTAADYSTGTLYGQTATGRKKDLVGSAVVEVMLPADARVIDWKEARRLQAEEDGVSVGVEGWGTDPRIGTLADLGRWASAAGYDAIRIRTGLDTSYGNEYIVLNRTVTAVRDTPAPPRSPLDDLRTMDTESARDALDLRKVPELKALLKAEGLPVSGNKRALVDRLVEHLGGGGGTSDSGDGPPIPKVARPVGRDISRDHDTLAPIYNANIDEDGAWIESSAGDQALVGLAQQQGFDAPPTVLSSDDFDRAVAEGGHAVMYRGINPESFWGEDKWGKKLSGADVHAQTREGDYQPGYGVFGNGYYFATDKEKAESFSDGQPGSLGRYALAADARVITYEDLLREYGDWFDTDYSSASLETQGMTTDFGRYAAARGYDAIRVPVGTRILGGGTVQREEWVVLNRGALIADRGPS